MPKKTYIYDVKGLMNFENNINDGNYIDFFDLEQKKDIDDLRIWLPVNKIALKNCMPISFLKKLIQDKKIKFYIKLDPKIYIKNDEDNIEIIKKYYLEYKNKSKNDIGIIIKYNDYITKDDAMIFLNITNTDWCKLNRLGFFKKTANHYLITKYIVLLKENLDNILKKINLIDVLEKQLKKNLLCQKKNKNENKNNEDLIRDYKNIVNQISILKSQANELKNKIFI